MIVSPSLLSADFTKLGKDVEMLNNSVADWLHIDVMDGVFVPNISFGFPVLKDIKRIAKKPLDVHLMIVEPDKYIMEFKKHGAEILTIHYEATTHLDRAVHAIKEAGMKAGVSLNPHTPVSLLEDIIKDLDLVLLMSVNPGFGGQKFIPNVYNKAKELKALIKAKKSKALIEVDGGVNTEIAKELAKCGVDAVVAGNFVFSSKNPTKTIQDLKNCDK